MNLRFYYPGRKTKKKNRSLIKLILLAAVFTSIVLSGCDHIQKDFPKAARGIMDLSGWDFTTDGRIRLEGDWEFYWKQLLYPEDFPEHDPARPKEYLPTPSLWADNKSARPELSANGFGTYRLTLTSVTSQTPLTLRINSLMGAYKVWINGSLAVENGKIGSQKALQTDGRPGVILIPISIGTGNVPATVTLVIQVSKYQYISGGTQFSFALGSATVMAGQWDRERFFLVFTVTMLLTMGCYHLVFFFFRKQDPSLLFFSVYCFAWMTAHLATGTHHWLVTFLFPQVPIQTIVIIDHIAYFFSVPLLFLFTRSMFPDETPSFLPYMYLGLAAALSLCFVFLYDAGQQIIMIGHVISVTAMLFCSITIFRAVVARRRTSLLILLGGVFLMLCGLNDILNDLRVIHTGNFISIGLLVFIASQSCSLARRFATAFHIAEDLGSELREKNIALSRLDSLKDEFIANTTHELCTPLSGIIGIAESMMAGATGKLPPKAVQNLDMLAASGKRLNSLVENILDFSRLKSQDLHLNLSPVDLKSLVGIALKLMTPLAQAKGLRLVNGIPEGLPPVMADENRLHQIFFNLVGNAIKYTPKGQITVSSQVIQNIVMEVTVQDTGIGIPKDKQDDIFLHFEQVRSEDSKALEGTGLGLPITKHLVELHRGSIRLASKLNQGTTFYFTLPLADEKINSPHGKIGMNLSTFSKIPVPFAFPEPTTSKWTSKGNRPRILVVDDDPINLQVVMNHLGTDQFEMQTALSGEEALEMMPAGQKPDLVLLDIMMPGMNGYDVCKKLRETHAMSALPVVMLTARNRLQDMVKGFESGANDYLNKPFAGDELLARVTTQLKLNRAYKVLKENSQLKKEIERRKITELDLKMMQQRLARILDFLDDAIIAVNECLEICFSNAACKKMLGYDPGKLLGQPVSLLFDKPVGETEQEFINFIDKAHDPLPLFHQNKSPLPCTVTMAAMDIENESLQVMIVRHLVPEPVRTNAAHETHPSPLAVIEEVNQNRRRIETLEQALVNGGSVPSESAGKQQKKNAAAKISQNHRQKKQETSEIQKKNILGVRVMKLALDLWQEETGMTKIDLAEQSRVWKVYMNQNGFERTQTLDKYLDINKFPKHPRWPKINRTIDFVLMSCRMSSPKKDALDTAFSTLRSLN